MGFVLLRPSHPFPIVLIKIIIIIFVIIFVDNASESSSLWYSRSRLQDLPGCKVNFSRYRMDVQLVKVS